VKSFDYTPELIGAFAYLRNLFRRDQNRSLPSRSAFYDAQPPGPHATLYEHILSTKRVTSAAFQEAPLNMNVTHPSKIVGRIVLGPRPVRNGYARIVATANGSGRIELLNSQSGAWCDADGGCTFSELWSAPPIGDCTYLSSL
jgi:hypothetical protein